jgi:ribonucleoside-triphosphate reductase (thioredoxin)
MDKVITDEFAEKYKNKQPKWGFNGLGYIVYKRTYARLKENGETEDWHETVQRCVNGAQKIGAKYTKKEAEKLYDYVFNLKCNFAGRMLWQLGTSTVDKYGLASLLNCWFVSMRELEDFCFLFEHLMLGGGVGFSVKKEDIHELPRVLSGVIIKHENTKDADFIVPDSRQGWVNLLRNILNAFFVNGKSFSYSTILVRGSGELIKGFGGTASGPKILVDGIESISKIIKEREGKKLRSIDVLDICNIIGNVVVAGNVRRSAEVAIGDPDDYLFLRAKRWDLGNIPNWRAMSNNSIFADSYDHISEVIWEGYQGNGEPYGFMNLPLCRKYGRLGEERKDNCEGGNPCVIGDTIIPTVNGYKKISEALGKQRIWNGFLWSDVEVKITGHEQYCNTITLNNGKSLTCTLYHKWYIYNQDGFKTEVQAKDLKIGDKLFYSGDPCILF